MSAFIASFLFVVLAEMGDKTQLLAMAFATRVYRAASFVGCFLATILNHFLAVLVGQSFNHCPFRLISFSGGTLFYVKSAPFEPPVPIDSSHPFRSIRAGHSGRNEPAFSW